MGRTIAIGDVHGCRRALAAVLSAIAPERDDTLVMLGDYVDRGPDSRGVLDELLDLRRSCNLIALYGNHEWLMLGAHTIGLPTDHWLKSGGQATLRSYGGSLAGIPDDHLEFLGSLHKYHETETAILVHAGYAANLEMAEQCGQTLYWDHLRAAEPPQPHRSGKTVFVGHTPQRGGVPLDLGHLVCIDTHCFAGQWLTAIDIDSREAWQASSNGRLRRERLEALRRGYRHCLRKFSRPA